jgi:AcrR family transcriptional regulator
MSARESRDTAAEPAPRVRPTGPRGPYAKGDRRRAQILQTAFEVFAAGGYRTASMVQIAAACGVTRAGLLHHFPTKEALLEAVLSERDRRAAELFFSGAPTEADDGVAFFSRLIKVTEHNARNPGIVSLYAVLSTEATDPSHPAHSYFLARYERSLERTRVALANLDRRGLLRAAARRPGVESEIIALMDGLQLQWLLNPDATPMGSILRARLEELIDADLT